ncbi:MAG: glycosyltransferase family 4 protein [Bacillota bacterium]
MKVGIFVDTYEPQVNGVVTSIKMLKSELEQRGHQVTIITIDHPEQDEELSEVIGLPNIPFPFFPEHRIGLLYSYRIIKKIKELNLDIIHTQTEFSLGILGRIMAKTLNLPLVHTYHTMYEDYGHYITESGLKKYIAKLAQKVSKLFCSSCNRVIVPTKKVKEALREYGVENQIEVIPTGINLEPFEQDNYQPEELEQLRSDLSLADDPVVLYVGRIAQEKSLDLIIKQFPKLLDKLPTSKLVFVGDGPERNKLEELAKELGIGSALRFVGEKPWQEIGQYYQLGDVFVSASTTETQGLTLIEAMASQLTVVAKYDKNLEGLIEDQVNGRIFIDDDNLADTLYQALTNEVETKRLVNQAYQDVRQLSAAEFGKRVENLYYSLAQNKQSTRCN